MKFFLPFIILIAFYTFLIPDTDNLFASGNDTAKALPPSGCISPATNVEKVVCLAEDFKAMLTAAQITTLQPALTTAAARKWSNLPCGSGCRNGLQFSNLSAAQVLAALAVIKAASGTAINEGYDEFQELRAAEDVLAANGGGSGYSSSIYFIAFLNAPSLTTKWMLQFGGHHYASNITFDGGKVIGASPLFEGVEPTSWTTKGVTYAPIDSERVAMVDLFAGLTPTQLNNAKLNATFSDVLLGPNKDGQFPANKQGLAVSNLANAQKALVLDAIEPWVRDLDDSTRNTLLDIYESELNATYIAYSGTGNFTNHADYGRIDGPGVWIEFVCQNGVVFPNQIHYHSVYRDHIRDYGASGSLTSDKNPGAEAVNQFRIGLNYPNPFSISTTIPFTLATPATVQLKVYNVAGKVVMTVAGQRMSAGKQTILLDPSTKGLTLAKGVYIYELIVENNQGQFSQSRSMVVH